MAANGKKDRDERLLTHKAGAWGTSSVDFVVLVRELFAHSKSYADRIDGNCSPYPLCAIPMLLSAIRCLMIEYESFPPLNVGVLELLTKRGDFAEMLTHYSIEETLRKDAEILNELRNEIAHPAHRPAGTLDNWPDYLRGLKEKGLMQSTGVRDSDYIFFEQMKSHRLFAWACRVTRHVAERIIQSNPQKVNAFADFLKTYNSIGFDNAS